MRPLTVTLSPALRSELKVTMDLAVVPEVVVVAATPLTSTLVTPVDAADPTGVRSLARVLKLRPSVMPVR